MTPDQIHEQLDLSATARDAFLTANSMPDSLSVFKALLSRSDRSLLNQLSRNLNTSPSRLIRSAIRAMFMMHFEGVPTCALGKPCSEPTATRPTLQPEKDPSSCPQTPRKIPTNPTGSPQQSPAQSAPAPSASTSEQTPTSKTESYAQSAVGTSISSPSASKPATK